jgi:squalene synthase HpnC
MEPSAAALASTEATRPSSTAPPAGLPALAAVLAKAGKENFPVALRLLPRREREWLAAVYGYARLVDDVGDVVEGDRLALLDWIEADLERAYDGRAEHVLLARLTPLLRARDVPRDPFLRLIEANRRDQRVTRYPRFADLTEYCTLSANPVGELVLHIFGVATPERIRQSDAVCTALQLAEHWQDVGEDYGRGRVYLPLEDLARFGVDIAELAGDRPSDAFRRLLSFEVARARELLLAGVPLTRSLRGWAKVAVAGYVAGGRAALAAVEHSGFDVLRGSPRAGNAARLGAALRLLVEAR